MRADSPGGQLLFTTVRITNESAAGISTGTGFHFAADRAEDGSHVPFVVTNKHVVAHADKLHFEFFRQSPNSSGPQLGAHVNVTIDVGADPPWRGHPDSTIDVVAISIAPCLRDVIANEGAAPYRVVLTNDNMPSEPEARAFDAIEDSLFVGYPNGHLDEVHRTPIVRRAITATPLSLPFGGKPTFLLDGSVFGGSSGSPVFLYDRYGYVTPDGNYISGAHRTRLVGIVSQTLVREDRLPLEVNTAAHTRLARELNLGVAYSWKSLEETVFAALGAFGDDRVG